MYGVECFAIPGDGSGHVVEIFEKIRKKREYLMEVGDERKTHLGNTVCHFFIQKRSNSDSHAYNLKKIFVGFKIAYIFRFN